MEQTAAIKETLTTEDIHRLRRDLDERRKNMTFEEYKADVQRGASAMLEKIARVGQDHLRQG